MTAGTPAATARRAMLTDRTAIRHLLEMLAAMLVGMVALGPLWPHSADAVVLAGHVLVLPAMVLAMLRRPAEYMGHHRNHG